MVPCHGKKKMISFPLLTSCKQLNQINLEIVVTRRRFQSIIGTNPTFYGRKMLLIKDTLYSFLIYIFKTVLYSHIILKVYKSLLIILFICSCLLFLEVFFCLGNCYGICYINVLWATWINLHTSWGNISLSSQNFKIFSKQFKSV